MGGNEYGCSTVCQPLVGFRWHQDARGDRAFEAIEEMNLPPYKTESGNKFTRVTLYPQKALKDMTQEEKIQD